MMDAGVSVIYQELNLIPYLSVAENIFLGREPLKQGTHLINWAAMYTRVERILGPFNVQLDPKAKVYTLGIAYQQIVEIAKALSLNRM
jgi:ribose transport system ATP-binding protein